MKSHNMWTLEEIAILKECGGDKPSHELVKLLPRHTILAIRYKRKRLGIQGNYKSSAGRYSRSFLDSDRLCKVNQSITLDELDNKTFQVLIGSVLGDGSIKMNGGSNSRKRNFVFNEGHGRKQCDYVIWKSKLLSMFLPKLYRMDTTPELITVSHPIFTLLRDKFYISYCQCKKSRLPLDVLARLDLFGLMVWYLDDGYLGSPKRTPSPSISAYGYNYDELVLLVEMLNDKFDLSMTVYKNGGTKLVRIPSSDRIRLLGEWKAIAKTLNLPTCMQYKLEHKDV